MDYMFVSPRPTHTHTQKIHHVEIKPLEDCIQRCGLWEVIGFRGQTGNERRGLRRRERDQSSLYVPCPT